MTRRSVRPPIARDERAESAARAIAVAWLTVLDSGFYAKAWGSASPILTKRTSASEFSRMAKGIRDSKGRQIGRRVLSTFARTHVKGLPHGSYVVLDFESKFEKAAGVVERVTTALDEDGVWRVMSYSMY
jgi:Protein of unknown function (DUF4019)